MARDTSDDTPITSRDDLAERLASGCKPRARWRIGTEHEKFGFRKADLSPVPYDGRGGIRQLLEGMEGLLGWEPILDRVCRSASPIPPAAARSAWSRAVSSSSPARRWRAYTRPAPRPIRTWRRCARSPTPLGIGFLALGASPVWSLAETPVMPKSRYAIMSSYMPKVGTRGLDMMYRTATVQVNLDYGSEADMVAKMRVSVALQPIATALFANSPLLDGRRTGRLSERSEIWRDTDNARSGMVPFVFEEGFGFEAYVDWALDVPMYFVKRGDVYHEATDVTFRQYMAGALRSRVPNGMPTMGDWDNHLSTLFPEVRMKRYLEMRGADSGPTRRILALPAFWVGLLYDDDCLAAAWDVAKDWSTEERQDLRDRVPTTALSTPFRYRTVLDVARDLLAIAREGLKRRARLNSHGADETTYLAPLEETLALGKTPADLVLEKLDGAWGGDLARIFRDYAY